jgi:hypothetical protein
MITKYIHVTKTPKGKKFDYIGKWNYAKRTDRFFTGKTEHGMRWRVLVDRAGNVYHQENK